MHGGDPTPWLTGSDHHPDWGLGDDLDLLLAAEPHTEVRLDAVHRRPDTFPCLVALAALRCGRTRFTGIPTLRHKESDRIHAMAEALRALGVACEEAADGLRVDGPIPAQGTPVRVPTPWDHRVVMAVALLGTRLPAGVELDNSAAAAKSWPGFFAWLARVGEVTQLG
jgi:3-phosphoshikimate 1-carboxyvinyltransferase